jgi:hypothetical protein
LIFLIYIFLKGGLCEVVVLIVLEQIIDKLHSIIRLVNAVRGNIVNNAKIANCFKAQSKHFVLIKLVIRINAKDRDTLKSKKKIQMCEKQV